MAQDMPQEVEIIVEVDPDEYEAECAKDEALLKTQAELEKWEEGEQKRMVKCREQAKGHWEEMKRCSAEMRSLRAKREAARLKSYSAQRQGKHKSPPIGLTNRIRNRRRTIKEKLLRHFLRGQSDKFHQQFKKQAHHQTKDKQ